MPALGSYWQNRQGNQHDPYRSHATISYHIHRAGEKLDSVNRAQTIFKAGQLGYLGANS